MKITFYVSVTLLSLHHLDSTPDHIFRIYTCLPYMGDQFFHNLLGTIYFVNYSYCETNPISKTDRSNLGRKINSKQTTTYNIPF